MEATALDTLVTERRSISGYKKELVSPELISEISVSAGYLSQGQAKP